MFRNPTGPLDEPVGEVCGGAVLVGAEVGRELLVQVGGGSPAAYLLTSSRTSP